MSDEICREICVARIDINTNCKIQSGASCRVAVRPGGASHDDLLGVEARDAGGHLCGRRVKI